MPFVSPLFFPRTVDPFSAGLYIPSSLFFGAGLGWAGLTRLALSYKSQAYRESLVVNFLSTRLCRPMSRPEPI
jgi:hypothetical protein